MLQFKCLTYYKRQKISDNIVRFHVVTLQKNSLDRVACPESREISLEERRKMMDNEILTLLSPNISHLVIYLIREGTIGICNGQIKVTEFNSR